MTPAGIVLSQIFNLA